MQLKRLGVFLPKITLVFKAKLKNVYLHFQRILVSKPESNLLQKLFHYIN